MNRTCCSCGHETAEVFDLGMHRLPDFLLPGWPLPPAYPLRLMMCPACTLLQLDDLTPRDKLYHDRYGFRSGINEAIRADLASIVKYALTVVPALETWLDIACNDGTLLAAVPDSVYRTGIDPLGHLAGQAARHGRIITDYFGSGHFFRGEFDVITSVSMFYDLADPVQFAREAAAVLAPGGAWIIQQNYAFDMLTRNAADNICHEHVTYFTVRSLAPVLDEAGLEINDVTYSDVNGGCFRVLAGHKGHRAVSGSVAAALEAEQGARLDRAGTWRSWAAQVTAELAITRRYLEAARETGKRVLLYGASTRGGTFLQLAGIGPDLLESAVERQQAKVGTIMGSVDIPVISEEEMRAEPPDALLVSPWFFRDVFLRRERDYLDSGGQMIFPLPRFEVVTGSRAAKG